MNSETGISRLKSIRTVRSGRLQDAILKIFASLFATLLLLAPTVSPATQLSLANSPLFLSASVPPNIFFLIDDSGSMDWNMISIEGGDGIITLTAGGTSRDYTYLFATPDNNYAWNSGNGRILPTEEAVQATTNMPADAHGVWRGRYAGYNGMYYNPEVTYKPWAGVDCNGTAFTDASPTSARLNPFLSPSYSGSCNTANANVDLTQNMTWTSNAVPTTSGGTTDITLGSGSVPTFYPAMYYTWTDSNSNGVIDATDTHTKVEIKSANAPFVHTSGKRTDCANPLSCTYAEEIGNFANWFSYYRRRVLTTENAAGKTIAPSTARMGYATLWNNSGASNIPVALMNQSTTSGNKLTLLNGVYKTRASNGTPLRTGFDEVGKYFQCASGNIFGYSASSPGSANCPVLSTANGGNCQQNFAIVMTDGYYNDSFSAVGNQDNSGTFAGGAYADSFSNTLADVAMKYYKTDLHSSLANNVPVTAGVDNNPAQHLVTFTVALGVSGTLSAGPTDPTVAFPWPNPTLGDPQKIDDMRHAAYNGRGKFLSAKNPDELIQSLQDSISTITDRTGSAATVAVNSRSLSTNTQLYQARFTSGEWSGDLRAIPIDNTGTISGTPAWSAKDQLIAQDWNTGRAILTRNSTQGVPFRWVTSGGNALSASLQTNLNTNPATSVVDNQGQARLNYLRGSTFDEGTNNNYRTRGFKLGDLVNSSPIYVGAPMFLPDLESTPHSGFRGSYLSRRQMIYTGGNDGMLHGFDVLTGNEKIAYVPTMVFSNLNKLTDPNYAHRYYVDGSPTVGDAFGTFSNGCSTTACWRTVLVGSLGAGGKGVFALDVTDPDGATVSGLAFNETNASNIALWEFTDATTPNDMGYTYGQATIARMQNGQWAAIFGNGYNSVNERPVLYIVNVVDGSLIKKIILDTTTGGSNGLSSPSIIDVNGDYIADYIYVGDLKGNMWKIDVTSNNTSSWDSAFKTGSTPKPLFVAVDGSNIAQPITERPQVGAHPNGLVGYMVYFGTGRYVADGDKTPSSSPIQTFYGIWDKNANGNSTPVARADLLSQTIGTATVNSQTVRSVTNTVMAAANWYTGNSSATCNPPTSGYTCLGWRTDLLTATSGSIGEMSVSDPILAGGVLPRIIFTTLIPDNSACAYGGSSWLMELNPQNGGRLSQSIFDFNGDNAITSADLINGTDAVAGINAGIGIMPQPVIVHDDSNNRDILISTGSTGAVTGITNLLPKAQSGRQSWRQLK